MSANVQRVFVDKTKISGEKDKDKPERVTLHHVPFKVEYEGEANVDTKFSQNSFALWSDPSMMGNQFRGRPLQGQRIDLPEEFEGLVATDLKIPVSNGNTGNGEDAKTNGHAKERTEVVLEKRFDSMVYWNWDRVPSGMDKHLKLMDWLELSNVLHAPVGQV